MASARVRPIRVHKYLTWDQVREESTRCGGRYVAIQSNSDGWEWVVAPSHRVRLVKDSTAMVYVKPSVIRS